MREYITTSSRRNRLPELLVRISMAGLRDIEDLDQEVRDKTAELHIPQPAHWEPASGTIPCTSRIYLKTFGCSHNISDSEVMLGLLTEAGFKPVSDPMEAEVWIINSCTVKNPSQDAFETWVKKAKDARKAIVVAGCVPQADKTLNWLEEVSVVGVTQIDRIVEVVEETLKGNVVKMVSMRKLPSLMLPKVRRNKLVEIITISAGCLGRCTFCKTKQARGNLVSYPVADIVRRVQDACNEGVKDIWLTSEDSGAYGRDIGSSLPQLLWAILKALPKDVMLRVGMTNPPYVLEHIKPLSKILKHPQVYEFIHIPVQSGANSVLNDMQREYRVEEFIRLVEELKKTVPNVHICTDIICGFPGETEGNHNETLDLLRKYKFPSVYISQFYPRPGTLAASMTRVPTNIVKQRSREVTELFSSYTSFDHLLGTVHQVYLRDDEDEKDKNQMVGHTKDYTKVVLPRVETAIGGSVYAKIVETGKWHVVGVIVTPPERRRAGGWIYAAIFILLVAVMWRVFS